MTDEALQPQPPVISFQVSVYAQPFPFICFISSAPGVTNRELHQHFMQGETDFPLVNQLVDSFCGFMALVTNREASREKGRWN